MDEEVGPGSESAEGPDLRSSSCQAHTSLEHKVKVAARVFPSGLASFVTLYMQTPRVQKEEVYVQEQSRPEYSQHTEAIGWLFSYLTTRGESFLIWPMKGHC